MRPYTRGQLAGADVVWCLLVVLGDRIWRFSTRRIHLLDQDGVEHVYDGGLSPPEVDEHIGTLSGEAEYRSLTMEVLWPTDIAALIERGFTLDGAPAVVFWVTVDETVAARAQVVLSGFCTHSRYGAEGTPVVFSVEDNASQDRSLFPDAAARMTEETFPASDWTISEEDRNVYYPQPFGYVGEYRDEAGELRHTSGHLGLVFDVESAGGTDYARRVLISEGTVEAARCYIFDGSGNRRQAYVVSAANDIAGAGAGVIRDQLRRPYSYAYLDGTTPDGDHWTSTPGALAFRAIENGPFYFGFAKADGFGGGLLHEGRMLAGAGDVLLWILARSSIALDRAEWETVRPWLNRYQLAGWIDEAVQPWQWVVDNLLPILPLSIVPGPSGLRPVVWRLAAGSAEAVDHLTAGPGLERVGDPEYIRARSQVVNEVRLSFALRNRTREYRRTLVLTGSTWGTDDLGATVAPNLTTVQNAVAEASGTIRTEVGVLGLRPAGDSAVLEVNTDVVYDESTAWMIIFDLMRRHGSEIRRLAYEGSVADLSSLQPGDVVLLTDAELSISEQVAFVEARRMSADQVSVRVTLLIYREPGRDSLASAA